MTLQGKETSSLETETPLATTGSREQDLEEKENRKAGALLALAGALMIALSAGNTLVGTMFAGGDGARGPSEDGHLVGYQGRNATYGSSGDDVVVGGPDRDVLRGGPGDDFIKASDGERDFVSCGPGYDIVDADGSDRVAGDCELVYLG